MIYTDMQTTYIGRKAEQAAAEYLERLGYILIDRNWRRRQCEIDLVVQKSSVVYLVEVKYRQSDSAGSGLEYITSKKLQQMSYAAERWVAENDWSGEYVLAAVELSGDGFEVTEFIDCIES
jgi:putative endonuclease